MIHQYINNGYHIVLDVNSGSVHVVDPVVYDAIKAVAEQIPELEKPQAARYAEWTEKYGSATQTEYFLDKGMMEIVPNVNVILESDTTDIALIRSQCGQEITDASWKMVFAQDEAEFDRLWEEMKGKLEGLGWDTLVEFDMEKYQKMIDARVAAME